MTEGAPANASVELLGSALTQEDLAALLGVSPRTLRFLLYRLRPKRQYRAFDIAKRNGGVRKIRAPILPLKRLQKKIADLVGRQYEPRSCVFGYVKDRNIQQNAERHLSKTWVLRVDLKDFFPSINFGRVRGILMSAPFGLTPQVATTVARICCHENALPQGSPASPVISNVLCRGLDYALGNLARTHRCRYSRYCDDLTFSTNRRTFPAGLALVGHDGKVAVGGALEDALKGAGFAINPDKTQLRHNSQRQLVTGLVVNRRVNVCQKFVRELRMMLHVWRKLGLAEATAWYSKHEKRNRPPDKPPAPFRYIVQGKVQYVGSVRGWGDPVYLRLAGKLAQLDMEFKPPKTPTRPPSLPPLRVFVEGHTDKDHIEIALASTQQGGRFADLRLEIDGRDRGSPELLSLCQSLSQTRQWPPCICVFDADERNIIPRVSNGDDFKDWGNNVYSLVLPRPPHRPDHERWCIEHLYLDVDLQSKDGAGRRLFFASEFDSTSGLHKTIQHVFHRERGSSLVIEAVLDTSRNKLGLSKHAFARLVRAKATADFSGFVPLFEKLVELRETAATKNG